MSDLYTDMKALEGKSVYANGFVDGYEQGKKDAAVHGRWIPEVEVTQRYGEIETESAIECSECGRTYSEVPGYEIYRGEYPPYCLCGAKMDDVAHGEWIGIECDSDAHETGVFDLWECSVCGYEHSGSADTLPTDCPHCHTQMDAQEGAEG